MWFRSTNDEQKDCTPASPIGRRRQLERRRRESRKLLLESLEERRVLTFLPAVAYDAGDNPQAIVTGDFNGDGRPDLAAANTGSNTVSLLLGNADGTFTSGGTFSVGASPTSIVAGDFNDDGNLDLVTANSGSYGHELSVLLGNGAGGFAAATSVPHVGARSVAVGDFNADGKLDLAVAGRTSEFIPPWGGYGYGGGGYYIDSSRVGVLLGSGSGGFGNENAYSAGSSIRYSWADESHMPIAVADLNEDAKADIVSVVDYNYFKVYLGNGNGTLQPSGIANLRGTTLAIADLNGDDKLDLATTNDSAVSIALGDGQGAFGAVANFPAGTRPSSVTVADFNVDGKPDLVVVSGQTSDVSVMLGQDGGAIQFSPPILAATGVSWVAVLAEDFNGDGWPDVATVDGGAGTVSVLLNDATWLDASAPSLQISDVTVTEGNAGTASATFTVTLSAPYSQDVTFHYETSDSSTIPATAGVDYVAQTGDITIPAGQTTAVIAIPVIGDRLGENTEWFLVNLSDPSNAFLSDWQGIGAITDDEPVIDFYYAIESLEGNTGTKAMNFVVRLSAASDQEVRVNFSTAEGDTEWTSGGYYGYYAPPPPATAGSDFQSASGTLVFAPGEIEKTISILALGDRVAEAAEAFSVDLSDPVCAWIAWGHGVGMILDDEPRAFLQGTAVTEGTGGTTLAELVVTLTDPSDAPISVDYATRDWSSAVAGEDFEATVGTVTFAPGETAKSIFVPVIGDSLAEYPETIIVELTGATGAHAVSQAYVEIVDDDAQISINDVSRAEGNSGATNFTFTVTMSSPATDEVRVEYETVPSWQAEVGSDYAAKSGTLVFALGQTSKTITVSVYGDTRREEDENFYVYIGVVSGNAIVADFEGTGTILNDDTNSTPTIDISNAEVVEGNSGTRLMTFTLTLSHASNKSVKVNYKTANGTAKTSDNDYVSKSGTITFSPGQTTKTITISIKGDKKVEPDEWFKVKLSGAVNGEISDSEGLGMILNDDNSAKTSSEKQPKTSSEKLGKAVDAAIEALWSSRSKTRGK